ncbi:MAG TPA: hypothetical protein VGQ31_14560 [Candidatus Limnocylindrales bacterium]|nr:hypothetical protein [Candidatus Limnocylindrales bacterium]
MTLALVVALSQLADGLAFQLALGHGRELNPGAVTVFDAFGPTTVLAFKIVAAVVLGIGSYALLRRQRARAAVEWLAVIGFVGCLTELIAVV